MTADRLAAFAELWSATTGLEGYDPSRRIVLVLCDVAKAAQAVQANHFQSSYDGLAATLKALSAALAEPTPEQKERR